MKLLIDPQARFKLERLCDYMYPQEVGGKLLGCIEGSDVILQDIFAVPNSAEQKNGHYLEYSPYKYFLPLYLKMVQLENLGNFHSHPNGTIPSEQDMKVCSGLNLWVIHHNRGEHTFTGAKNYEHLETILLNEAQEIRIGGFRGNKYFLGDLEVDNFGRLLGDNDSLELLKLPYKTRRAYLKFLQLNSGSASWSRVQLKDLAIALNSTPTTVRKWLKNASNLIKISRYGISKNE